MVLSFKVIGDVMSDYLLMQGLQKDSMDAIGFRTLGLLGGWVRES